MKGHEYPRQLIKQMLEARVPQRLAAIRAAAAVEPEWPPNPKAYLLADTLPAKEEQYPCVLVTSSEASPVSAVQAGLGDFIYEYQLSVGVAVVAGRHGGEVAASIGRDRILLAVREALRLYARLADDCVVYTKSMPEVTGAPGENMQSAPLSLGNISVTVAVTEALNDWILDSDGNPVAVADTSTNVAPAVDTI